MDFLTAWQKPRTIVLDESRSWISVIKSRVPVKDHGERAPTCV